MYPSWKLIFFCPRVTDWRMRNHIWSTKFPGGIQDRSIYFRHRMQPLSHSSFVTERNRNAFAFDSPWMRCDPGAGADGTPCRCGSKWTKSPLPTEQSILRPAPALLLRLHDHRGLLPPRRRRRFVLRDPLGRAERQTLQILRLKAEKNWQIKHLELEMNYIHIEIDVLLCKGNVRV